VKTFSVCVLEVTMVSMVPMVLFCLSGEDVQRLCAGGDNGFHGSNGSVLFVR